MIKLTEGKIGIYVRDGFKWNLLLPVGILESIIIDLIVDGLRNIAL